MAGADSAISMAAMRKVSRFLLEATELPIKKLIELVMIALVAAF